MLSVVGYCLVYDEKIITIFTCCALGYLIQNLTNRIAMYLDHYIVLFDTVEISFLRSFLKFLLYYTIPYVGFFILFRKYNSRNLGDIRLNLMSIGIVFVTMIFTRVFDFMDKLSLPVLVAQLFLSISTSIPILFIQNHVYHDIQKEKMLAITNQLLLETKKEYGQWKESRDTINIKLHDLKKMVEHHKQNISEEYFNEIHNAIEIYDSSLQTGNEVLDMVIYERNEICIKNHISFIYLVDGKLLSFMANEDLYALFTNIIDNAIEASKKIEDETRRVIHLNVSEVCGTKVIVAENYYQEAPIVVDNIIITSKEDKDYHGFGILSMKQIVKKYNGVMQLNAKNDIFTINIGF